MKNKIKLFLTIFIVLVFVVSMFSLGFYIRKTISYSFFYEDSVKTTIKEMVKKESLK